MIPPGYNELTQSAARFDLSARGRLCLIGADRQRFLHGQVTNNVNDLKTGQGTYAALANNKGKMTSDLNIYILADEILLDFEPGLADAVKQRLEKFIIADDVEIVDASSFRLVTVQGPGASAACEKLGLPLPKRFEIIEHNGCYVAGTPRLGGPGIDIFFPEGAALALDEIPEASAEAFDAARIAQGIPRFGVDMDENTLVPEAIESAISYNKGCYIGQEVIARIRTYGQVAKALRGLRFEPGAAVPKRGDKIVRDGKEVGWITSAIFSTKLQRPIALGYVRKECNQIGSMLAVNAAPAEIAPLPFAP
jgi:folate-binding protein YgfZ